MARNPDGRKRKRERLGALVDGEALCTSQYNEVQQQSTELIQNVPSSTEKPLLIEKTEWALQPHVKDSSGELDKLSLMEEPSANGKDTHSTLQRLKQTEEHEQKSRAIVKRLSADLDKDEACARQLEKLRIIVEKLGGKLEDGWYVNSQRRSNNGIPFFIFMSPTNERFRSRVEVARHLGLYANPVKRSPLGRTRSISNSRMALVPYVRKNKSLIKLSRGTSHKPLIEKRKLHNSKGKAPKALKAITDVNDMQITSTSNASSSFITQRCQDVLRSIIASESFAALSNMVNRGTPATSLEANLPSFVAGSLDLKLIHLRLSTGAYGQTPELFSADIQQVWKNIITAGNELVIIARSLSELSDNLYKHQIKNLFDGPFKENISNEQSFGATYVHVGPLSERIIARPNVGKFSEDITASGSLARSAGLAGKDGYHRKSMPLTHRAIRARLQRNYLSKKVSTKARYQLSKKMQKKGGQVENLSALKDRLLGIASESFCQKCGLKLGEECAACKQCQASYHNFCVVSNSTAREWCCPMCLSNQVAENPWKGVIDKETTKELCLVDCNATVEVGRELQKSTGKTGVCEACKKEDDNVLLCDGCDAAYHMSCLSPSMDSVPDGYWYCPACDEAGKKTIVSQQDAHVHNCVVCERVSRELSLCAENESTAQVFFKETSPVYLAPERSRDNGYAEHSLDQGVADPHPPCVEKKSSEAGYLAAGTENACKLCGVDEGKKSILCSNCRRCYHLSCLRPALRKRPRKTWFCPSCLCRVCKTDTDDDKILLCDSCDDGYHTYCLKPPIPEIPEEAWYCPSCAEVQTLVHTSPSKTEVPKKKRKSNEPRKSI